MEDISLTLTQEEAWELLSRCINSSEMDTETSKSAIKKLANCLKAARILRLAG